jgi:branched-chain amino acid transport system substrate-binding protein
MFVDYPSDHLQIQSKRRKIMKSVKYVLVCLVVLACCLSAADGFAKSYPIGAFFPMTGSQAYYGRIFSHGPMTAVDQINKAGGVEGYSFDLIITDFKNVDVTLCVTGLRKMISVDKIPVVLASYTATTLGSQPICEKSKVLMLNGASYSPQLVNKPYLFSLRLSQSQTLPPMLKYFWDKGVRRLGLVYASGPMGEGPMKEVLIPLWTKWGGTIVAQEPQQMGTVDFSASLTRIRAGKPDAIVAISGGQDLGYIVKGAREIGLTCPIAVNEWAKDFQAIAGDTSKDVFMCVEYFDRTSPNPVTQEFVKAYEAQWKEDAEFFAANFYDAVKHVIPELIKRVVKNGGDPLNGEQLEKAIWIDPKFKSVYGGELTFKTDGTVDKPMVIFQVVDGKLTQILQVGARK